MCVYGKIGVILSTHWLASL